jgi:hypothetical protein
MEDISEAEAYRQAYEETYNALKSTPVFKHLKDLAAPEAAPVPPPPPPKEPGLIERAGKALFGGNKEVDFNQLK